MADRAQDLERIEATLAGIDSAHAEQYFGVRMMRQSLERQRDQLSAEVQGWLDVRLTRDERDGTGAELSLVADVLASLQDGIASIAQVMAGQPTARGLIPAIIKEGVELRVAFAEPGSLNLRLVPVAPMQEPLFEDGDESLLELSMEHLMGLLSKAEGDRQDLLQEVAYLGPRATSHVQALTHSLAEAHASACLEWRSRHLTRSTALDTRAAAQLREVLREVEEDSRELVFAGRLVGGSLVRGTFELELEVGPPETTVIGGKVLNENALAEVERLFGQMVTAVVEVRESRLRSGETKETHVLKSLSA